jgi:hypothetical protein
LCFGRKATSAAFSRAFATASWLSMLAEWLNAMLSLENFDARTYSHSLLVSNHRPAFVHGHTNLK